MDVLEVHLEHHRQAGVTPGPGAAPFANVAICSYILEMASTGIRELKDNLSRGISAESKPGSASPSPRTPPRRRGARSAGNGRQETAVQVVSTSLSRAVCDSSTARGPATRRRIGRTSGLPRGTAAELIDADRGGRVAAALLASCAQGELASAASVEHAGVGIRYIESSALVAALLRHDAEALKSLAVRGRATSRPR